ncbi:MAG: hypothetical protein VYC39_18735 [Myxococcota bacterium]|nr:hypothetical protein [Myxococcota bacterium]
MRKSVNHRKNLSITIACLAAVFVLSACGEQAKIAARRGANLAKAAAKGEATLAHDLERLCKVFATAEKKDFKDELAKSVWLMDQSVGALVTPEGIKMFQNLGPAEPGQKWFVVTDAAAQAGLTNWDCPAIRKVLPPPSLTLKR